MNDTPTLKDIIDQEDRKQWGPEVTEDRRRTYEQRRLDVERRILPTQKLKLVRDGSIKYNAPKSPITSPDHSLEIFRSVFAGADKELVYILSLSMNNEYINCPLVAWGTIGHVVVHPREVFKHAISRDNAAKFIMAHNHPSGDPTPSPEDMVMLEKIRDLGIELGCRMVDFIIIGDGGNAYYSHRELNYDYF